MTLFEQFYNEQNGKGIDTDGYGFQCVSLFKWWLKKLGDPNWGRALGGDGFAHMIYYRFYELGYDKYFDLIWDDAQIGDVLVYGKTSETPLSHVSFFMGDLPNGKQHYSWGQNQSATDMRANTIVLSNSGIIAVLRPKNRSAVQETATSTPSSSVAGFSDVDENAYYADAVKWAKEAGIISGKTNGIFDPDSSCSRADVVLMLKRYNDYLSGNSTPKVSNPGPGQTANVKNLSFPCEGIDISEHNGDIDLSPYTNNNFVIIRCSWWLTEDKKFRRNVEECEKLGIPYGLYCYSYALDTEQAKQEAEFFVNLAKTCNPFALFYDCEPDSWKMQNEPNWSTGYPSKEYIYPIAKTFCATLENAGYNVGIYAGNGIYDKLPEEYVLWYPHYFINDGIRHDGTPSYANICYIHQYTSVPIDKNYWYAYPREWK